jgi:hypothetical protein
MQVIETTIHKASGFLTNFFHTLIKQRQILFSIIKLKDTPLLSLSAKNNQERLEHKTFTKNPDFSHSVRK